MSYIDNEGFFSRKNGGEPKSIKDIRMATEAKTKPNLMLLAAIAGVFLILQGQGIIKVDPQPNPTPIVKPEPTPSPTPTPSPVPIPNPIPTPNPTPKPEPPVVLENFPQLPIAYEAVSLPIKASLFTKEKADDALNLARYYRDSATALRNDPTITSNAHFIKVYNQSLQSVASYYPDLSKRNAGLGKAIDDVLATQGLDISTWTDVERKKMAEAMDAISYRLAKAYEELTTPTPKDDKVA